VELVRTDFSSGSLGIHELPANTKPFARSIKSVSGAEKGKSKSLVYKQNEGDLFFEIELEIPTSFVH
jgi:hypothetical protein